MKRFLPASLALLTFLATWAYRNLFEATQQGAYLAGLGLHTFVGPLQPYVQVFTKLGTAPVAGASLALAVVVALGAKRCLTCLREASMAPAISPITTPCPQGTPP